MNPPIRSSLPRIGDSLATPPASPYTIHVPTREELGVPNFGMAPLLPSMLPTFRLSPLFFSRSPLAETVAASAPAAPLSFVDFLPALFELADGIESMDLDATNIPVNRGSGLCRFSEFTPVATRPTSCTLTVQENTHARVHGEIRPIRGAGESLITRFSVDFQPDVFNAAPLDHLRIDGFSGVDSPDMTYSGGGFSGSTPPSLGHGNDLNYENFFGLHGSVETPFGQEAEAPPHRDFMIRFAPIESTVLSALQREVGGPRLFLWAFLPTMGISDPAMFERLGIRFNTMPRRFSDLLRLFSPLFNREQATELRQNAPYLNPNTEIRLEPQELVELNAERATRHEAPLVGLRQALPLDREELLRWDARRQSLNAQRATQGLAALPSVTTNRGPVIDWVFSDLMRDPTRLAATPAAELPSLSARARLRATRLTLPMGTVSLNAGAELHVRYALERVANPPPGGSPVQRVIEVRVEPISLASVELDAGSAHISADHLDVDRLEFRMTSPIMIDPSAASPGSEMDVTLNGVHAQNLGIGSPEFRFNTRLNSANLTSLHFHRTPQGFSADVNGLEATGAHLGHSTFDLDLATLSVPNLHLERDVDAEGHPGPLRIRVPSLGIDGIEGSGRVPIHNGSFHLNNGEIELQRGRSIFEGDLDLRGSFPNGFTEGPIALDSLTVQAAVEDLQVQGRARIEMRPDGFSLRRSSETSPLNIHFNIGRSWLEHTPPALPPYLRGLGASEIIHTRVDLAGAQVQVDDLSEVEVVQADTPAGRRGQIRQLQCGPITLHHVAAGGRIWAGLPIWGYIRGFFSELGGGGPSASTHRPDFSPLLRHLPEEARNLVGDSDFLRIGGVNLHREESGAWQVNFGDTVLALRESGGRHQFAGIRVHRFHFGIPSGSPATTRPNLLEHTDSWVNIFLNDPDRGGSFRFFRWPERP